MALNTAAKRSSAIMPGLIFGRLPPPSDGSGVSSQDERQQLGLVYSSIAAGVAVISAGVDDPCMAARAISLCITSVVVH